MRSIFSLSVVLFVIIHGVKGRGKECPYKGRQLTIRLLDNNPPFCHFTAEWIGISAARWFAALYGRRPRPKSVLGLNRWESFLSVTSSSPKVTPCPPLIFCPKLGTAHVMETQRFWKSAQSNSEQMRSFGELLSCESAWKLPLEVKFVLLFQGALHPTRIYPSHPSTYSTMALRPSKMAFFTQKCF